MNRLLAASSALAAGLASSPALAEHYHDNRYHHDGDDAAAVIIGGVIGAVAGYAIGSSRYYGYGGYGGYGVTAVTAVMAVTGTTAIPATFIPHMATLFRSIPILRRHPSTAITADLMVMAITEDTGPTAIHMGHAIADGTHIGGIIIGAASAKLAP